MSQAPMIQTAEILRGVTADQWANFIASGEHIGLINTALRSRGVGTNDLRSFFHDGGGVTVEYIELESVEPGGVAEPTFDIPDDSSAGLGQAEPEIASLEPPLLGPPAPVGASSLENQVRQLFENQSVVFARLEALRSDLEELRRQGPSTPVGEQQSGSLFDRLLGLFDIDVSGDIRA